MKTGWRIAAAILLGFAIFPALLLFPPYLFPWMYLALLVVGLVGGTLVPRLAARPFAAALAIAALIVVVGVVVLAGRATSGAEWPLLASSARLMAVVAAGAAIAVALRRRHGPRTAFIVSASGVIVLLFAGVVLAHTAPGQPVVDCSRGSRDSAPLCQSISRCRSTAERRALWTVERIVDYDTRADSATCTYTAWGGILVGTARNGGWTDGPIPAFLGWP